MFLNYDCEKYIPLAKHKPQFWDTRLLTLGGIFIAVGIFYLVRGKPDVYQWIFGLVWAIGFYIVLSSRRIEYEIEFEPKDMGIPEIPSASISHAVWSFWPIMAGISAFGLYLLIVKFLI